MKNWEMITQVYKYEKEHNPDVEISQFILWKLLWVNTIQNSLS